MNEITKEIFKYLNVLPDEIFRIEGSTNYYKINENLKLFLSTTNKTCDKKMWSLCGPYLTIGDLITGENKIKKIIKPTDTEKIAINYAKACGYNWLAKDESGAVYAFVDKPIKHEQIKQWGIGQSFHTAAQILLPISFLSWKDEEPYYIGDDKNEIDFS